MTNTNKFTASPESKSKAKKFRRIALISWVLAMAGQVFAILKLIHEDTLTWLFITMGVILVLAITGSLLWKKANRLDPASEKDKLRFFIQNQLGAILGVLAFLPLVIFIFKNKNLDKKTKGIAGTVAIIALVIAGATGIDLNPPSIEQYTQEINEQTSTLKTINNNSDAVFWTKAGNKYHINEECQHIKGRESISNGSVKESWEQKGISELCKTCEKRARK
mgnify:FL=1